MLKRLTVVLATLALVATSGAALAQEQDADDTVFNWGYDAMWRILTWNLSPADGLHDCTLTGPYTATYSPTDDGVSVDELSDESGVVSFPARPQDELAEDLEEADGPVEYSGADGECGLTGASVEGPNGQVNHGMFMKTFNSLFEGPGRGCVVRHLAQSDLGKGDQQINVPDVDPDAPELTEGAEGTVEFESAMSNCRHGNQDEVEETESGETLGFGQSKAAEKRAENAAKKAEREEARASGDAPGKSGSAPGRDK